MFLEIIAILMAERLTKSVPLGVDSQLLNFPPHFVHQLADIALEPALASAAAVVAGLAPTAAAATVATRPARGTVCRLHKGQRPPFH